MTERETMAAGGRQGEATPSEREEWRAMLAGTRLRDSEQSGRMTEKAGNDGGFDFCSVGPGIARTKIKQEVVKHGTCFEEQQG